MYHSLITASGLIDLRDLRASSKFVLLVRKKFPGRSSKSGSRVKKKKKKEKKEKERKKNQKNDNKV